MFRTCTTLIVSRHRFMIFALAMLCSFSHAAPAQADANQQKALFNEALRANAILENERLQEIVSKTPKILLELNQNGMSLIEFAFVYLNEDLVSQTNLDFLEFLTSNDFFGQEIDRAEHFSFAVQALQGADDQIGSIDLSDDMIVHNSREPFIALLSQTITDRVSQKPLSSEESLALVLDICDPEAFEAGQEKLFGTQLIEAIASALVPQHRSFVEVYLKTGTLDATCVEGLLT